MIDKNEVVRRCQAIMERTPLLFVGSGMSVAERLPTMGELGRDVVARLRAGSAVPANVIDAYEGQIAASDFEAASDLPELEPYLNDVRDAVHAIVLDADLTAYDALLDGNRRPMARLLAHYKGTRTVLRAITSNYDRLLEYQAGLEKIPYFTGFYGGYIGGFHETATPHHWPDLGRNEFGLVVYKVHGSVDWFADAAGDLWRLPLRRSVVAGHRPLIVIPGRYKYIVGDVGVHRVVKQSADDAIVHARAFAALGYGFNDPQLDDRLCTRVQRDGDAPPLLVLARNLTEKVHERLIDRAKNYIMIEWASDTESRVWTHDTTGPVDLPEPDLWTVRGLLEMIE